MAIKAQFKKRTSTDYIVVHCAATKPSMDIGVREIRQWHKQKDWLDIGYHFVIRRDGTIEEGRNVDQVGAGVKNHNYDSVHICLVGGLTEDGKAGKVFQDTFTDAQEVALFGLIAELEGKYPNAQTQGHRDFVGVSKDCPCFDVKSWLTKITEGK